MKRLIVLLSCLLFLLCGCKTKQKATTEDARFEMEYVQGLSNGWTQAGIIKDTETGQKYLFVKSGYAGGLTKLE